jgi:hypothetical protein
MKGLKYMNNVLFRRGDQTFIDENVPLNDGQIIFNETDEAIYLDNTIGGTVVRKRYGGGNLSRSDVDSALSTSSTNPIQNQAVATALNGKAPTSHASTATTYGVGTTTNYGHCKTINDLNKNAYANGEALSAYQGKVLNDKITKCEVLQIDVASFSSLPQTVTNANIESDMVVVNSFLGNPPAQTGDWTVTTTNGSLTISGTISRSTTLTLYLMKSR